MIVTCPSCSARYKINAAKIKGRGAKITCPRCSHRFVVYREGEGEGGKKKSRIPDDISTYDFASMGITWRVRKGIPDETDLNTDRDTVERISRQIEDDGALVDTVGEVTGVKLPVGDGHVACLQGERAFVRVQRDQAIGHTFAEIRAGIGAVGPEMPITVAHDIVS